MEAKTLWENVLICSFFHEGDCLAFKKDSILDLRNQK